MNELKKTKDALLRKLSDDMEHIGIERMGTQETGHIVDMIKDLAEAEYYCSIVEAMEGESQAYGYQQTYGYAPYGYTAPQNGSQWRSDNRMGYQRRMANGRFGYSDVQGIREEMRNMGMEERERMKEELRRVIQEV